VPKLTVSALSWPPKLTTAEAGPANTDDAARFDQSLSRLCELSARPAKNVREPVGDPECAFGPIVRLKPIEQCECERLSDQRIYIGQREP
jgi:hypothetical protein